MKGTEMVEQQTAMQWRMAQCHSGGQGKLGGAGGRAHGFIMLHGFSIPEKDEKGREPTDLGGRLAPGCAGRS